MSNGNQITSYILTIDANEAGQRLDNYLIKHLKGVPKGHLYRIVRKGEVRVNKKRCRVSLRLVQGDQVRIPPLRVSQREQSVASETSIQTIFDSIIYEDPYLIAINKPARWAVHGGTGNENGIIETLKQAKSNSPYIELVHRLDKDTSGCLLVAKSRKSLLGLQQMLKSHDGQIQKYYTVMIKGHWTKGNIKVDTGLSLLMNAKKSKSVHVDRSGKSAITFFKPKKWYKDLSLMDVKISTGRMHQIRVHCAHLDHPVAGDSKYGDFSFNRQLKKQYQLNRIFLHARQLSFNHPITNQKILIKAPLADDLANSLSLINAFDK